MASILGAFVDPRGPAPSAPVDITRLEGLAPEPLLQAGLGGAERVRVLAPNAFTRVDFELLD
ncbi:MAG: hypothetical protein L6Q99_08550 [Planctomycetes bacterium]|nr:hypothetical protein [Planctomycetota bacterium]